jgi:thiamine biosynthesis protein ThiS
VSIAQTIEVYVNGQPRRVTEGLTVDRLLAELSIDPARVAVELNREIVRQAAWEATPVLAGAQVEIVWFVGGG